MDGRGDPYPQKTGTSPILSHLHQEYPPGHPTVDAFQPSGSIKITAGGPSGKGRPDTWGKLVAVGLVIDSAMCNPVDDNQTKRTVTVYGR